jgi:hypothetical protein
MSGFAEDCVQFGYLRLRELQSGVTVWLPKPLLTTLLYARNLPGLEETGKEADFELAQQSIAARGGQPLTVELAEFPSQLDDSEEEEDGDAAAMLLLAPELGELSRPLDLHLRSWTPDPVTTCNSKFAREYLPQRYHPRLTHAPATTPDSALIPATLPCCPVSFSIICCFPVLPLAAPCSQMASR